ncbi:MAG TPA: hypothetical protein VE136_03250 [Anaerolineales bacterium]|jgi:hypothetical protein|nr:hypothetical protein [Anaerolineales bacterium]
MKRFGVPVLFFASILFLAACATDSGVYSGTMILEGRHVYGPGEVLNGIFLVVDGEAVLDRGARVEGPIYVLGGSTTINGQVDQDISVIGGNIRVGPQATIGGDLRVGSGELDLSSQAMIKGSVWKGPASDVQMEDIFPRVPPGERLAQLLPWALVLAFLAYLSAVYMPRPVARISQAEVKHPVVCTAMGMLVGIVGPVLLVFMAFTVILIPATLIGLLIGVLTVAYGWIGFGTAFGRWLARRLDLQIEQAGSAFLGTLVFMILIDLISIIPFVGSLVALLAVTIGLGAVMLTRFGLREFVPAADLLYEETG